MASPRTRSEEAIPPVDPPVDPDVDLHVPRQRAEWRHHRRVVPVIALGGMLGASARHSLELAWAGTPAAFPWATFLTNVSGCLLIGVLMVFVVEAGGGHPLLRPFLGVGVLGGYTTFSTYAVQVEELVGAGQPVLAALYLVGTLLAALAAVAAGSALGRGAVRRLRHRSRRREALR